jgi:hypothetical protein
MLHAYQVFITGLATREKAPSFEDLIGMDPYARRGKEEECGLQISKFRFGFDG